MLGVCVVFGGIAAPGCATARYSGRSPTPRMINEELVEAMAIRARTSKGVIARSFRESTAEDMAQLCTFAAARAWDRVALHAHRLRGASEVMGATPMAEASRMLEAAALGADDARAANALDMLEREVRSLDAYLENLGAG
jgi:HPt (histidine-containing phosphotransfer) domain-containing protein